MADPNPLAQVAGDIGHALTGVVNTVLAAPANLTHDVQQAIDGLLGTIEGRIADVLDAVRNAAVPLPPPLPAPVNVIDTLDQIAQAVALAENILNKSGLVIATGSFEASLSVALPGNIAGAQAKITVQITPKPHA